MIVAIIVISIVLAVALLTFYIGRAVRKANLPQKPENPNKGKGFVAWIKNHIPTKRRLIQVYAALLYNANIKGFVTGKIYTGENTKYMCVPGLNCYSCPGAVGACPMGAFQNALAASDTRAPYYVLGILALFGLMCARAICGFLCPIGLCQELLYKIRTPKLKKSRVTRVLSYFKYVILVLAIAIPIIYAASNIPLPAFCKYICPAGTLGGAVMLLINPKNADMFGMLGWQFTWKFSLAIVFIVASIFIFRFFCRFICPLGAIYGFFNKFALLGVTVDKESCTDCGLCVAHCKMDIKHVGDHECINCGECMAVCPTNAISWKGSKIFLRHSAVTDPVPQEKPLPLMAGEVKIAATVDAPVTAAQELAATDTIANDTTSVTPEKPEQALETTTTTATEKAVKPKKPLKFWLEVSAWAVAMVVLIFALVYYNFIYKDAEADTPPDDSGGGNTVETGYNVGDTAPDFTLDKYNTDGTFNLYEQRGKVSIVYFWQPDNAASVAQIPYYNELAKSTDHAVVAISGSGENVQDFIDSHGWGEYALTFVQDVTDETGYKTFQAYGGSDEWALTVIIDENGKVVYNGTQAFGSGEQIATYITRLTTTKKGYNVGDIAPDFTLDMYNTDGTFNLCAQHGKITVVNFWATWCTGCVEELPYFNEFADNHPEIAVVAIHGSSTDNVQTYINRKGWADYRTVYVQDVVNGSKCQTYISLGGGNLWPMTVIVGADGKVLYNSTAAFKSYEQLETLVMGFTSDNA